MNRPARSLEEDISYRKLLPVSELRCFHSERNFRSFPVCPRCQLTLEREYQAYCDRCGQALDWEAFPENAVIIICRSSSL